ncbi:MAG: hypothetical protein OWQ48_02795 [Desulfurococcus sp.]|nr:hypothetical protein [Desulfurococcus sp.]
MDDKIREYVERLIIKLYEERDLFFSDDELNSEGWKIFNEIVYHTLKAMPWYKRRIRDLRRKPTVESIFTFTCEAYGLPSDWSC